MKQQILYYPNNRWILYLRCTIFQLSLIVSTVIFCPIMLLAVVFHFSVRYKLSQYCARYNLWAVNVFCGLSFEVEGLENIPKNRNAVILCKHQSAWETLALQLIFPELVFLLKRELLWLPIWGWAMATLKPIAINRESQKEALGNLLKQGTQRLKEGLWVAVFPEGTRTAPQEEKKFNAGGALLAVRSGYPVMPIAHNAGEFWPRYSFIKYPGVIKLKIGPLISSDGKKAGMLNDEAKRWINNAMSDITS